jgi:hypothetical protein
VRPMRLITGGPGDNPLYHPVVDDTFIWIPSPDQRPRSLSLEGGEAMFRPIGPLQLP